MFGAKSRVTRGFCLSIYGLVAVMAVVAVSTDPADARARRKRSHASHVSRDDYSPPYAAIVVDANSGKVLHESSADSLRHPASLTKIMTLYLLFERLEAGKMTLNTQMPVSAHAAAQAPTKLGLKPGQTLAVEDAIRGLVTKSANDAAVVVAEAIGSSEDEFASLMTRKAHALGMSRTTYRNASGLPDDDQVTTARDQALLGRAIQERFPRYYRYFSLSSFTYHGEAMRNHNHLLGQVEGVDGIKTGYTYASGFNLVTSVRRNNRHIVAVVLGGSSASSRDARMRTLIENHIVEASNRRTATMIAEAAEPNEPRAGYGLAAASSTPVPAIAAPAVAHVPLPVPAPVVTAPATTPGKPPVVVAHAAPAPHQGAASSEPIKPIAVKTIKVKLATIQTASLGPSAPMIPVGDEAISTQSVAVSKDVPKEAPKAAPTSSLPPQASAPWPAPKTEPVKTSAWPSLVSSAAAAPAPKVETPRAPQAPSAKAEQPRKPQIRNGWSIQVGAFEAEGEAKQRLGAAQGVAKRLLAHADAFTEAVSKGSKTFYRARFAGLERDEAEAACKYLKRNDIACMTIKN
jgi:D-alanyl-D-alanine carboxypeptidase